MLSISVSNIEISYENLLARLGFLKAKTKIENKTEKLIKEILYFAEKLICPKAAVAFENIAVQENKIDFENGYRIESFDVAKLLKNCFKAYGLAVTIGKDLELKRDLFLQEKETFKALILDACGSAAAEAAITLANNQIFEFEAKISNGLAKRYSPGYGDWRLEKNKDFLDWIGAKYIGIEINEFFQMNPEKSVSAIIGVYKKPSCCHNFQENSNGETKI